MVLEAKFQGRVRRFITNGIGEINFKPYGLWANTPP